MEVKRLQSLSFLYSTWTKMRSDWILDQRAKEKKRNWNANWYQFRISLPTATNSDRNERFIIAILFLLNWNEEQNLNKKTKHSAEIKVKRYASSLLSLLFFSFLEKIKALDTTTTMTHKFYCLHTHIAGPWADVNRTVILNIDYSCTMYERRKYVRFEN